MTLISRATDDLGRLSAVHESGAYAKIIADSIGDEGVRLTSFELRFHRFILAEVNTHCVLARNSASSRAIPVAKQLERYMTETAYPYAWPTEKPGMQGGDALEGRDLERAHALWTAINLGTYNSVNEYLDMVRDEYGEDEWKKHCLHKSVLNRVLEPMQWHTALITGAHWDNVWDQRVSPLAQPEFNLVAEMARTLLDRSEPETLKSGAWTLPYMDAETVDKLACFGGPTDEDVWDSLCRISVARCARTSMMTQDGIRDPEEDLRLFDRLAHPEGPPHMSPFEHVCTPAPWNSRQASVFKSMPEKGTPERRKLVESGRPVNVFRHGADDYVSVGQSLLLPSVGKFRCWLQYRHLHEARVGHVSYR